ncbi:MAG: DNA polymerase IV [Methanomicrobiales archaeon]|nr:DNA polymerase IV [Methanomicrobiales archaeon]
MTQRTDPYPLWFHVDMDSFFASIEIRERPELAGKPVVIGADPKGGAGRGVVSTCSYEARACGISSAMPISQAYRLCPHAVFLPVRMPLYVQVSRRIMALLARYATECLPVSIDEAYLAAGDCPDVASATHRAEAIRRAVAAEEGITCSVGIGQSRVVAKIASGFVKPDGLTVVPPEETAAFLAPLPAGTIPGIGAKTSALLQAMGIETIGDLASYDIQQLIDRFGKWGIALHELACGRDIRPPPGSGTRRSLGREWTFPEDTDDPERIREAAMAMADELCRSLAARSLRFRTVTLKIRNNRFETSTRSFSLPHPAGDPAVLRRVVQRLLDQEAQDTKVRLIGVRLSSLETDTARQTSLFDFA